MKNILFVQCNAKGGFFGLSALLFQLLNDQNESSTSQLNGGLEFPSYETELRKMISHFKLPTRKF